MTRRPLKPSPRDPLLAFLLNPRSYPHRPRRVQLAQTHASFLFFAPPYVYKIKKPVNFGFLNFSTLDLRHRYCQQEVTLNRRLCPGVYLGVLPIYQLPNRLSFTPPASPNQPGGRPVEYAVHMRQLPARGFLDRRVDRGKATVADVDRIIARLHPFYQSQHPTPAITAWGGVRHLRVNTNANFRIARRFIGNTVSQPAFDAIRAHTNRFYRRHAALFETRMRQRRILDCHGDLHLEHIHLTPRILRIYDCIEFNDGLRYIDVASDIAFLAMDLDYHQRPDLAAHLVRRMTSALRDPDILRLMDFYKTYRACVRGKVESLRSVAPAAPKSEREESARRARRYFQLALRYTVAGSRPMVLVVMGRAGSGKSALASALAAELGWTVVASDRVRKELARQPLRRRGDARTRARLYSPAMTRRTYGRLLDAAEAETRAGRAVILDATFSKRDLRDTLRRRFLETRTPVVFLEASAPADTIKARLRRRDSNPREISDARLEDYPVLSRSYEPPVELPKNLRIRVSTRTPPGLTLRRALQRLTQQCNVWD